MRLKLPLLLRAGGLAAAQGTGRVAWWAAGSALRELGGGSAPRSPLGHLHCCIQARVVACTQWSVLDASRHWGGVSPSPLTRHQLPQPLRNHQLPGVSVPAGTSARLQPCLRQGTAALLRFLPLVSTQARPHPLAAFPGGCSPSASQPLTRRAQLGVPHGEPAPSPSCSQAPPSTLPQFPNLLSTTQRCGMARKGEGASLQLRGWAQGLLQELLNLNEVCFQLLVEQQEGRVRARC